MKTRFWVSAGLLTAVSLSFMGCQAMAPLFGSPDEVDVQGRRFNRGEMGKGQAGKKLPVTIDAKKELVITDLTVVEDPQRTTGEGPWTFAYLIKQMAGGRDPELFVRDWIDQWMVDLTINGDSVAARKKIKELIVDPWPRIPGTDRLDLNQSPFRLLAITNRMDVRTEGNIGEGRFVFGVVDRTPAPPTGELALFTVIFEYGITLQMGNPDFDDDDHKGRGRIARAKDDGADQRMKAVQMWADKWHKLGKLPYGPAYNAELQRITDTFARAGADPSKPNGSALNQLRTNEIQLSLDEAFGPTGPTIPLDQIKPWEMREYRVGTSGFLVPVPVAITPKLNLNNSAQLATYINQNEALILRDRHQMEESMMAGVSLVPGALNNPAVNNDPPIIWNAPGIRNPEARFKFAQNTCSGCHLIESGFETDATGAFVPGKAFMHIRPRLMGQEAELSPFMTGVTVNDPVTGKPRFINDMDRRIDDMEVVLGFKRDSRYYDARRHMMAPFPAKAH